MADRPIRLNRKAYTWDAPTGFIVAIIIWRFFRWGFRWLKPIGYHPVAIIGITLLVTSYALTPWLVVTLAWSLLAYQRLYPYSYHRHVSPRVSSFFVGFKYRHRLRAKLAANNRVHDEDRAPTISHVQKIGCTTKVRVSMTYGDAIEYWRERAPSIAQTFNALDVKINPYRRDAYGSIKIDEFMLRPPFVQYHFEEKVTKARWLDLEFMTKDPFAKSVGFEYIDFHRPLVEELGLALGSPVGPKRDGTPYLLDIGTHLLVIAMSGRGKSNAERAMVYADYPLVLAGLLENWIFDGKRGVEARAMEHCFARHEYGRDGADAVLRFFQDAEQAMYGRLDEMADRGETLFVPEAGNGVDTPDRRAVKIYIDEMMILEAEQYAGVKKDIYKSISAIQQQGRAAGFTIIAFAQNPKLENLPLRDGFPEIQIGGLLNRRQIDTAIAGGWDLGAREIPADLPGVFYIKTESGMALEQIRYAHDRYNAIKGLPQCPESTFSLKNLPKEELREHVRSRVMVA